MSQLHHAIVWIDHREAKVCRFTGKDHSEVQLNAHTSLQRLHHRREGWEAGNPPADGEFFRRVEGALGQTAGILVTGPGDAKASLKTHLDNLRPGHASQVFILDTVDQPGYEALLSQGREYFHVDEPSAPPMGA